MSSSSHTKFNPLAPKHIFMWFAFALGGSACYLLYKDANIPVSTLLKKMVLFGVALTVMGIGAELTLMRMLKNRKKNKRKNKHERMMNANRTHHHHRSSRHSKSSATPVEAENEALKNKHN